LYAQAKPVKLLKDTTVVCSGDSVLIKFPEELVKKTATFTWQTPKAIIVHSKQLYLKYKGIHIVKISDGKQTITDTTFVKLMDKPKLKINDTVLCGNPININLKNKNYKYSWNYGETAPNLKIEKPGMYWVKVNNNGCFYTDTFKVIASTFAVPNFNKEMQFCDNESNKQLSVKAPSDVKLFWNTGSNASSIPLKKEGVYWVKSSSKSCGIKTDSVVVKFKNCDCDIFMPTGFTPNEDDKNDLLYAVSPCEFSYFSLHIYDRWGNTVYKSNNIANKWDGKFKGNPCPDDVYVYRIDATQKVTDKKMVKSGHISLFR
jgi:gliding motility-associated-like protein